MNWKAKAVAQGILSRVPGGGAANDFLQNSVGALRNFGRELTYRLKDWQRLALFLQELGIRPEGLDFLEIGTGWYPTLPICFSLVGARSFLTFDIARHLKPRLTFHALHQLGVHLPAIAEAGSRPLPEVESAYQKLCEAATIEDLLSLARGKYIAPADPGDTGFKDQCVDVVFSNSVLQYVPLPSIEAIMRESRRILRPGGLAVHNVYCGDDYANFDGKITPINYLAYSSRDWARWNNRLTFQNRLRPMDFLQIAERAGFRIALVDSRPDPHLMEALESFKVAPEFESYPREELASTWVRFAARAD